MARINKNLSKGLLVYSFAGLVIFGYCWPRRAEEGTACAGQLLFDGVPVDITTTTNEDLVIALVPAAIRRSALPRARIPTPHQMTICT